MKIDKIKHFVFLMVCIVVVFSACKSKKRIVHTTSPLKSKSNVALFSDMLQKQITFHTFSSKINLSVDSGTRSVSSKGSLKIENGKAIQLSIQPLFGVELFRFFMTPDSVIILDRMNKRYVKEALSDIKQRHPVGFDYFTLQALLTNHVFVANQLGVAPGDFERFEYSQMPNSYYLKSKDRLSNIEYAFSVNADDRITFSHLFDDKTNYVAQWNYNDFAMMNNIVFPSQMSIKASSSNRNIEIDLAFSNVVLEGIMDLHTSVPASYLKVNVEDVIKFLTKK